MPIDRGMQQVVDAPRVVRAGIEVSGSGQAGLAGTLSTLDQPMVVFRPIEMPNVTMCCQNAGSASVAGTLLLSGLDVFPM